MIYPVRLKPRAIRDLADLPVALRRRILEKVENMRTDLRGDVKRLTNYTPEYRLRVSEYRVLFEIEDAAIIVYRIRHRREAYR
jgi:mRNA interferase RelE/StbE